jgi:6-pyruvoyltetrahydropterin/6-carboxytetrahydropterin synthase
LDLVEYGVADVMVVEAVGCEKFAELAATFAQTELELMGISKRVKVVEVECFEHGANSAIYRP